MIRKIKEFFKKQKDTLFARRDVIRKDERQNASSQQVKDATRYVGERFSRAITRLSER